MIRKGGGAKLENLESNMLGGRSQDRQVIHTQEGKIGSLVQLGGAKPLERGAHLCLSWVSAPDEIKMK